MLVAWDGTASWSGFGGDGVQPGVEASAVAVAQTPWISKGTVMVDVTDSLVSWIATPSANHGWVLLPTDNDGVDLGAAEGMIPPRLQVAYR